MKVMGLKLEDAKDHDGGGGHVLMAAIGIALCKHCSHEMRASLRTTTALTQLQQNTYTRRISDSRDLP